MASVFALAVATGNAAAQGGAAPTGSRARLEQQLQAQLAANEALKARIAKLEAALKSDVCADPAAADALLKEGATPTPPAGGEPAGITPPAAAPPATTPPAAQ